jgi:hypothetical protein
MQVLVVPVAEAQKLLSNPIVMPACSLPVAKKTCYAQKILSPVNQSTVKRESQSMYVYERSE